MQNTKSSFHFFDQLQIDFIIKLLEAKMKMVVLMKKKKKKKKKKNNDDDDDEVKKCTKLSPKKI